MIFNVPTLKESGPEAILIQELPTLENNNENLVDAQPILQEEVVTSQ